MTAEQKPGRSVIQVLGDLALAGAFLKDGIMPRVERQIFKAIKPEYPEGFNQRYQELINQSYVPIVIANHQSHADGIPFSVVTNDLTELAAEANPENPLNGFYLVIASTVTTGEQGGFLKAIANHLKPHLERRHCYYLPFVRESDKKLGAKPNRREALEKIQKAIQESYGLGFFPETHLKGGRRKNIFGRINGMQEFNPKEFEASLICRIVNGQRRNVAFIPVGIDGGGKLLDPDIKIPGIQGIRALYRNPPPQLVQVRVGMPITQEALREITESSGETQNIILAKAIAQLLPVEAQGVFAPKLPRSGTIFSRLPVVAAIFRRES